MKLEDELLANLLLPAASLVLGIALSLATARRPMGREQDSERG